MALRMKKFLGYFKLRTGCLFLGWIGAITRLLIVLLAVAGLIFIGTMDSKTIIPNKNTDVTIIYCALTICSVSFALHVVLLVAVYQNRRKLLKLFLISMTVYISIMLVAAIVVCSYTTSFVDKIFIYFLSSFYLMVVVRSYYLEEDGSERHLTVIKPIGYQNMET